MMFWNSFQAGPEGTKPTLGVIDRWAVWGLPTVRCLRNLRYGWLCARAFLISCLLSDLEKVRKSVMIGVAFFPLPLRA